MNGDCYEVHGRMIMDLSDKHTLCHGEVFHRITGWHGHCWIEIGDKIIDKSNGNDTKMKKEEYYAIGRVKDVKIYSRKEAMKMMLKTRNFGSW